MRYNRQNKRVNVPCMKENRPNTYYKRSLTINENIFVCYQKKIDYLCR